MHLNCLLYLLLCVILNRAHVTGQGGGGGWAIDGIIRGKLDGEENNSYSLILDEGTD